MHRVMAYVYHTPLEGWWTLQPNRWIIGDIHDHEFIIEDLADGELAKCPTTRRSVSGQSVLLEGAPVSTKSDMQKTVAISITESELEAGVGTAQDMLYAKNVIESTKLKVKLPIKLRIDNKGAVQTANNWSCGGRMRHVKLNFLRELKEQGILKIEWISGWENLADLFTKNLGGADFKRHKAKVTT